MSPIVVRYKAKPDLAETKAELVRAAYEELHRVRPRQSPARPVLVRATGGDTCALRTSTVALRSLQEVTA